MTKREFIQYITEAVEAMDERHLESLFPPQDQPDLYTLLEGLTGLRGEVKKVTQSSLRLQNEVQRFVENQEKVLSDVIDQKAAAEERYIKVVEEKMSREERDLRHVLRDLIRLDEGIKRSADHLRELPEATHWKLNEFKQQIGAWKEGFFIFEKQWKSLLKSTGMYATGTQGTTFDPELHEAVAVKIDPTKKENTILETEQIGWLHKQKVIQQAKVVVNKN